MGLAIVCAVLLLPAQGALGSEPSHEVRHFDVTIDGKAAGTYEMEISATGDGMRRMKGNADVRLKKYLLYNFHYSYAGTESWRDDRLEALDSTADDDGKKFTVHAARDARTGSLVVAVNGQQHVVQSYVWTTTYWRLPNPQFRGKTVPLLDCDTGKYMTGTLEYLGVEKTKVLNQMLDCAHYRLTGGDNGALNVELWYDGHDRLVHQVAVEDGHRAVFTLASIGP